MRCEDGGGAGVLGKDSAESLREGASLAEPSQPLLTMALKWPWEREHQKSLPSEHMSGPS